MTETASPKASKQAGKSTAPRNNVVTTLTVTSQLDVVRAFLMRTRVNGARVPVKVFMGRVVVAFEAKPHPVTCNYLRRWGFEWSPALGAWVHPCGSAYALARERARVREERAVLVDRAADYAEGVELARKVRRLVHDGTESEAAARAALNELSAASDRRASPA